MQTGVIYAALAYTAWGLFPLYFKLLSGVGAFEVVLHRTVWCMVLLLGVLALRRQWAWLAVVVRTPRVLGGFALSALLLAVNWVVYVWAVNNDHVLDASLGYFILPLVHVGLGYVVLGERPRRGQWWAVVVAAAGVLWLAVQGGRVPWVALTLASTFGLYGLLRKVGALGALEGLALETMLLSPLAAGLLLAWALQGQGAMVQGSAAQVGWLVLSGPLTAVPLLLFAAGARRVSMATLGILQYISPSLQLLLGVLWYGEPFAPARAVGFVLIWTALLLYSAEGWWHTRRPALA